MKDLAIQYALPLAALLFALLVATLLRRASSYFAAKEEATTKGSALDHFYAAMAVLTRAAADAVQRVESTMRPDMGKASADGKLTPEEAQELKDEAIRLAKEQARAAAPQVLEAAGLSSSSLLGLVLEHLVESAAAKHAGDSRVALARLAEAATGALPSVPAAT